MCGNVQTDEIGTRKTKPSGGVGVSRASFGDGETGVKARDLAGDSTLQLFRTEFYRPPDVSVGQDAAAHVRTARPYRKRKAIMGASTLLDRAAFQDELRDSAVTVAACGGLPPAACGVGCEVWHLCLTAGLDDFATRAVEQIVSSRTRLAKGEVLYRPGEEFHALYAIRSGSCKSVMVTEEGREQVMGYHMRGEFIGADGLATRLHPSQAAALEDTEVCTLPFDRLEAVARRHAQLQHALHLMLAMELARERRVMLMLGAMRAEQRLASFLLDLSRRYQERGYSSTEFILRMTREEIGSFLGLKLETVSRLFSRFNREGLIHMSGRSIRLADPDALRHLLNMSVQQ